MGTLDINTIRDYLLKVGSKIEYPILVNAFKQHLYHPDPNVQGKIRTHFKDCVNRLATVSLENNMKFIILREEFKPKRAISNASQHSRHSTVLQRNGSHLTIRSKFSHREDESDSSSLQTIDPLRRKWIIEACNCNFNALLSLLRKDPKLASYKDTITGYTALHWAAKFGNLNIINLIAGTYGVSANIRSSAGYTPLHVAYIFNKLEAADLLLRSYKANPKIRDFSGKIPMQLCRQT